MRCGSWGERWDFLYFEWVWGGCEMVKGGGNRSYCLEKLKERGFCLLVFLFSYVY